MINKPPPLKGLSIGIPILIPIKGNGFIKLELKCMGLNLRPKTPIPGAQNPKTLGTAPTH